MERSCSLKQLVRERIYKALHVLCVLTVFAVRAFAQDQPEPGVIQPFSTVESHEYDSINLATLGIQLNATVRSKSGHIPFSFALRGASQVQDRASLSPLKRWFDGTPKYAGQENHIGAWGGAASFSKTEIKICDGNNTGYGGWVYTDSAGTAHPVGITGYLWLISACGPTSGGAYTTDGSGLYVYIASLNGSTGYAIDVNGNKTNFGPSPTSFADADGNSISFARTVNGSTITSQYTDTLSENAVTVTSSTTFGTSPAETDTWTDALGGSPSVKLNTTMLPLLTSFNCPGLDQTQAVSWPFPTSVSFPDNSSMGLTWEINYSNSADYTGRLASITLPTRGQITYQYSGGTNGINCLDGTPATMTRKTPDGTWTYTHTPPYQNVETTQVQDPQGNNIVYNFTIFGIDLMTYSPAHLQTEKQVYNGGVSQQNLIQTVITCYNDTNSSPTSCSPNPASLPILEKDEYTQYTTYPNSTGYSAVKTFYDNYGRVYDVQTYDFGLVLINEKVITYGSGSPSTQTCTAISTYIIGKPCRITLFSGSQTNNIIVSETRNAYNATGNLTQTWNLVSGSGSTGTYLSKQYSYANGVVQTSTDVNGQVMNYTTTSCNNMFVTSQYPTNFTNLKTSQVWDCVGGVVTSATDANSKITQSKFFVNSSSDPFYRPVEAIDQLQNVTSFAYTTNSVDSAFLFNGGNSTIETLSTLDSTGRAAISQLRQAPGTGDSGNWDTKSRSFDGDGRQYQTSLTCATTAGSGCAASTESQTYDALSRPLIHHGTGGDIVTKTYVLNDVLSVLSPAPSGENTKAVQKEYDGLSRLKSSCLISTASGSNSCGQANAKTGFLTQYSYDAAGRLLQTVENYQVTSPRQPRTYTYDFLGRVTTETNPESGTTKYFWDTGSSACGSYTSNGDLMEKRDNAGVSICYGYDGLHRLVGFGPSNNTNCTGFQYDSATPPTGVSVQNTQGRMVEAYTNSTCNGHANIVTDKWFSYSPRGEVTDIYESTPNSGGYYHITKTYWPDGSLASLGGFPGVPTIYYGASDGSGLDGEGRVTKVTASSGVNPVTAVTYTTSGGSQPIGSLTQVTYGTTNGAGDTDNFSYDLNTSRMNQYTFTVNGQSVVGKPTWNTNGTLQQLQITQDPFNSANVQTCTYGYDDLVRVSGDTCKNPSNQVIWQQAFSYDPFGNVTKTGSISWACATCYDVTTNHYNSTLSSQISYDADGNLTNDTFHTYQWDANGRPTQISQSSGQSTQTYDAQGNMVEQSFTSPPWVGQYLYDEHGYEYGFSHPTSVGWIYIPLPGGGTAVYTNGTPAIYYLHADWLGSGRLSSTQTSPTTVSSDIAFAPFGERYATTGNAYDAVFGGMKELMTADMFDGTFREYHPTQGRWISPDPVRGTGNKYVYADNNPLSKVDPYGLEAIDVGFQLWFDSEMNRGDPLEASESHPPQSVQTPGIAESEIAYLDRVDEAFAATPQDQQKTQAREEGDKGQPVLNIQVIRSGNLSASGQATVNGQIADLKGDMAKIGVTVNVTSDSTRSNIDLKHVDPKSFDKGAIPYFFVTSEEVGSATSASGRFGKTVGAVINEFSNGGDKVVATHETLHILRGDIYTRNPTSWGRELPVRWETFKLEHGWTGGMGWLTESARNPPNQ
jgi:RHS repeat-associated protein